MNWMNSRSWQCHDDNTVNIVTVITILAEWLLRLLLPGMLYCWVLMFVSAAAEFIEEVFDAKSNEVYDILIDVSPRQEPGTEVR